MLTKDLTPIMEILIKDMKNRNTGKKNQEITFIVIRLESSRLLFLYMYTENNIFTPTITCLYKIDNKGWKNE